jgi:hypothetical protein
MARKPLFTDDPASDLAYRNIRASGNENAQAARAECEELWETYEAYADPEFLVAIRSNFDARYWEMYLTTALIDQGFDVVCPKPGPDVGIEVNGRRLWFEATSPSRGADGAPDQVPEMRATRLGETPIVRDVPNEKMVLRYLNSISEKYDRQYAAWLKAGTVTPEDAFVIAINPRRLGHEFGDTSPPRILQAAFAIGSPYISIDRETLKAVDAGFQFRDTITKASKALVKTGVFHQEKYAGLSGLLCSRVDAANRPDRMGDDFQLVPNPQATVPLPDTFRLRGTYFRIEQAEDGYIAKPEASEPSGTGRSQAPGGAA